MEAQCEKVKLVINFQSQFPPLLEDYSHVIQNRMVEIVRNLLSLYLSLISTVDSPSTSIRNSWIDMLLFSNNFDFRLIPTTHQRRVTGISRAENSIDKSKRGGKNIYEWKNSCLDFDIVIWNKINSRVCERSFDFSIRFLVHSKFAAASQFSFHFALHAHTTLLSFHNKVLTMCQYEEKLNWDKVISNLNTRSRTSSSIPPLVFDKRFDWFFLLSASSCFLVLAYHTSFHRFSSRFFPLWLVKYFTPFSVITNNLICAMEEEEKWKRMKLPWKKSQFEHSRVIFLSHLAVVAWLSAFDSAIKLCGFCKVYLL